MVLHSPLAGSDLIHANRQINRDRDMRALKAPSREVKKSASGSIRERDGTRDASYVRLSNSADLKEVPFKRPPRQRDIKFYCAI